ncbi:MAG TPA: DUF2780 domain-containing protein [Pyrinomonadaceae bacterium]|nr:DUF2780 domain-containing protein [Pyrinomonadaceae bacterium]
MKKLSFSGFAFIFAVTAASALQAQVQTTPAAKAKNPSPELVSRLTKELSITPEQAVGGSGALFGLAKSRLNPGDFTKVANVVPGMDGLLQAAPKPKPGAADMLGTMGEMLPGKAGALASVAGSFKSLGLSPKMAVKFVPIMTKFVNVKGGAGVADLLAGALQ